MLGLFLSVIFVSISFVLWCILHVGSQYDQMVDDEAQEEFLKKYHEKHNI